MNTQQLPQLSIGEALKAACNKIFQFNGRSRRSEFWWTALVVIIICAITHDTISWLIIVCHRIYRLPHSHDCVPLPRQRTV